MNKIQTVLSLPLTLLCAHHAAGQEQRPNIVYIMSDDHSAQAVSAYGGILSKVMSTPTSTASAARESAWTAAA